MSEGFLSLGGLPAGTRVAGYRVEEPVGAGGMAVVHRARDERLGRLVALKVLAPALAADEEFRRRFIAESRAAAAVDNPHIIPVYEAGEAGGALFIAMRLVTGGDLAGVLARGPLPPERALWFLSPSRQRWTPRTGWGSSTETSSRGTSWWTAVWSARARVPVGFRDEQGGRVIAGLTGTGPIPGHPVLHLA